MDAEKIQNEELGAALAHISTHWDENRAELALDGFHQRKRRRTVTRAVAVAAAAVALVMWAWPALNGVLTSAPASAPLVAENAPGIDSTEPATPFTMEAGGVAL